MIQLLYEFGILLYLVGTYAIGLRKVQKYRTTLSELLGVIHIPKKQKRRVWLHAVSVGEVKAAATLLPFIDGEIVVTSCTKTGLEKARAAFPYAVHCMLPNDSSFIMTPFVAKVDADLLLLSEGDIWPNMLKIAKKHGATVAIINGKLSERSYFRLSRIPFVGKKLYEHIDIALMQTEAMKKRLSLFMDRSKIYITGNLKLDAEPVVAKKQFAVTFGSTHAAEDLHLISCVRTLVEKYPDLIVYYVPRHPERFDTVYSLMKELPCTRYSAFDSKSRVVLVDVMGELMNCYAKSLVGVVCGSFDSSLEGHDIFEPVRARAALLYGPYMQSQLDMVEVLKQRGIGRQVNLETLCHEIAQELENPQQENTSQNFKGIAAKTAEHLSFELKNEGIIKTACE